ncbi:MAG: hypothetical protein IT207_01875 [Fimbriimonadaceae bacterium]|nr:hypothetical protein [Fimbriimonadaceae bacterium]
MKLRLAAALPYAGAFVGIAPIMVPLDVQGLWTEAETVLASNLPTPDVAGCPDFLGCSAPDPMAPCPGNCTILSMSPQYRCNWPPIFWDCDGSSGGRNNYYDKRDRWKWKCAGEQNFVSCGPYYAIDCCTTYDPGEACAGNSGLVVCEGTPPGY